MAISVPVGRPAEPVGARPEAVDWMPSDAMPRSSRTTRSVGPRSGPRMPGSELRAAVTTRGRTAGSPIPHSVEQPGDHGGRGGQPPGVPRIDMFIEGRGLATRTGPRLRPAQAGGIGGGAPRSKSFSVALDGSNDIVLGSIHWMLGARGSNVGPAPRRSRARPGNRLQPRDDDGPVNVRPPARHAVTLVPGDRVRSSCPHSPLARPIQPGRPREGLPRPARRTRN